MFWLSGAIEQMLLTISPSKLTVPVSLAAAKAPCDAAATAAITANLERYFFDMDILKIDMKIACTSIADRRNAINELRMNRSNRTIHQETVINYRCPFDDKCELKKVNSFSSR
ncbi:hypothetical protein [Variovorax paradoxus]|uniref:hypothetical protein n=1 Tax=Variovorax paradoxus TaxID=34073 RepID=UPI0024797E60